MKIIGRLGAIHTFFFVFKHASVWAGSSCVHLWQALLRYEQKEVPQVWNAAACATPLHKDTWKSTNKSSRLWVQKLTCVKNSNESFNHSCHKPNDCLSVMFPGMTVSACVSCVVQRNWSRVIDVQEHRRLKRGEPISCQSMPPVCQDIGKELLSAGHWVYVKTEDVRAAKVTLNHGDDPPVVVVRVTYAPNWTKYSVKVPDDITGAWC